MAIEQCQKKENSYGKLTNFVNRDVANFILRKMPVRTIVNGCPKIMDYIVPTDNFKNRIVTGNTVVAEVVVYLVSKTLTEFDKSRENEDH
jgi:hypothetical protein